MMWTRSTSEQFQIGRFLISPWVILRMLQILFAIIVFGVLADNGKVDGYSVYDGKDAPLHFTIGIGVSAFIIALLLLSLLIANEVSSALVSVQQYLAYSDLALSSLWTLLWFIAFCWTADAWRKTDYKSQAETKYKNAAQSAIAFSFFSIIAWAGSIFYGVREVRNPEGQSQEYAGAADPSTAYAAFEEPA